MLDAIKNTYFGIRTRRPYYPAAKALVEARERATDPARRYYGKQSAASIGASMGDGGQWAYRPQALGLRFYGWADEITGNRDCGGWHMDEHQDQTVRGCVYLLTGRDGCTRYVPAYREGSERSNAPWQDRSGGESAVVYLGDIETGERGGADGSHEQAAIDAARYGDGRAEHMAEQAREYDEAWGAGLRHYSLISEAREARAQFLLLRPRVKAMSADSRAAADPIAKALQSALCGYVERWSEAKADAFKLADEWSAPANGAASSDWQRRRIELANTFIEGASQ